MRDAVPAFWTEHLYLYPFDRIFELLHRLTLCYEGVYSVSDCDTSVLMPLSAALARPW